jgi:hypothetical protein
MAIFRFFFSILNIKKLNIQQSIMFWEKNFATQKKKKKLWFGPHAKTPKKGEKKKQEENKFTACTSLPPG